MEILCKSLLEHLDKKNQDYYYIKSYKIFETCKIKLVDKAFNHLKLIYLMRANVLQVILNL